MNPAALFLVLGSCFSHATWNLIAKRSNATLAFFWMAGISIIVMASPAFWPLVGPRIIEVPPRIWLCLCVTGVWQAGYYMCLSKAYRAGDVSIVYPLSRASLLFVVPLAGVLQGRWPVSLGGLGIAIAVVGCLFLPRTKFDFLTDKSSWRSYMTGAGMWAIVAAFLSSLYTVTDAIGMSIMKPVIPGAQGALIYGYLEYASVVLWLTPVMIHDGFRDMARTWRKMRFRPSAVGGLDFVTYLMVLMAYSLADNVAYVAAMRQFSTILGVLAGILFLKEPGGPVRMTGTVIIASGLVLIALSR